MPTPFQTFNPGDLIEDTHVEQFIDPIQGLESGSSLYREATNTGDAYKVDFSSGLEISSYTPGLEIKFKAPIANTGAATLTVAGPSGDLTAIALTKDGGQPLDTGDIVVDQVVSVIYTEDASSANPRFEVVGGLSGKQNLSEKGQANGYAELDGTGKVPASQLPSPSGGSPIWGDLSGDLADQPDLFEVFQTRGLTDVMEVRVIPGTNTHSLIGMPTITAQGGTYTARTPASGTPKSKMNRIGFTGSGSTVAGWRSTSGSGVFTGDFSLVYHFALSDSSLVGGARMFIGLSDSTAAATNVDPAGLTQCIGIAQLSGDSTQFYAVWGAGSSNSEALGLAFDVTAVYRLEIVSTASANFMLRLTNVDTGASATINKTTGPTSATNILFRLWRCSNGSGTTTGIETGNLYIEKSYT